jgi:hypothetical protein
VEPIRALMQHAEIEIDLRQGLDLGLTDHVCMDGF